jgi:lysophospholipase L1-like esterase
MLFGDSMEETMGPSASPLWQSLRKRYPQTAFSIINNSRGAENVESALERLEKLLPNLIIPDIVIVGSYAYNPFVPHSLSKHTQFLTELLTKFKQTGSKVYLLAEIAPAKNLFGSKLAGLNWDDAWRYTQSTNVIALLENALKVATKLEVEVVDVYHDSIVGADKSGDIRYISSEDYLHPSVLGHQFTAAKIAEELDLN